MPTDSWLDRIPRFRHWLQAPEEPLRGACIEAVPIIQGPLPWHLAWRVWFPGLCQDLAETMPHAVQALKRYHMMIDLAHGYGHSPNLPDDWWEPTVHRELLLLKAVSGMTVRELTP